MADSQWKNTTEEICLVYMGRLATGEMSPGYIPSISGDRRPAVYVCRKADWDQRDFGTIGKSPASEDVESEMEWAAEFVRMVTIDHMGLAGKAIVEGYNVMVPAPFGSSFQGRLVRRSGEITSVASVPRGSNKNDDARRKMTDRSIPLEQRMRMARSVYGTPVDPVRGIPYTPGLENFPSEGEVWS
jgi:hypothetical protein